jgi:hypothetical protein
MWSKAGGGALRSRTCMARAAGITAVVKHVVTLPVEFDASFNRALRMELFAYGAADGNAGIQRRNFQARG